MFEQVSDLAERVTTDLSRRKFISWLGRGALAVAAFGGSLAYGDKPPPPPPATCILNGGCCAGGSTPYYDSVRGLCCSDAYCRIGSICAASNCCNGGGRCKWGTQCFGGTTGCSTPCSSAP
jgi:hypothetical protein